MHIEQSLRESKRPPHIEAGPLFAPTGTPNGRQPHDPPRKRPFGHQKLGEIGHSERTLELRPALLTYPLTPCRPSVRLAATTGAAYYQGYDAIASPEPLEFGAGQNLGRGKPSEAVPPSFPQWEG